MPSLAFSARSTASLFNFALRSNPRRSPGSTRTCASKPTSSRSQPHKPEPAEKIFENRRNGLAHRRQCRSARLASAYSSVPISQPCVLKLLLTCENRAAVTLPHSLKNTRRRQAAAFFLLGLPLRACPKPMALASSERRLA